MNNNGLYQLVAVNKRTGKGVVVSNPLTYDQAAVLKGKHTEYPQRELVIETIQSADVIIVEEAAIDPLFKDDCRKDDPIPYFCTVRTETGRTYNNAVVWRKTGSDGKRYWDTDKVTAGIETLILTDAVIGYANPDMEWISE